MGVVICDLIIVTFTIYLTSVANAALGIATYYTAPYICEYFYMQQFS